MLDTFDLIKIQQLVTLNNQKLINDFKTEMNKINCDLSEHITENYASRIKNVKNIEESKKIYTKQDHHNNVYVRNERCWASDLDLTCISPWNSTGHTGAAGTAITKNHIVFAHHYPISVGATVRFITKNNETVERKLIKSSRMFGTDIVIGLLDEELPSSITPCKLLPKFWYDYIARGYNPLISMYTGMLVKKIPVLCLDFEEKAIINKLNGIVGNKEISCMGENDIFEKFNEVIISGDSGNPCFVIIDNQLVLLTIWSTGGYGAGHFLSGDTYVNSEKVLKCNLQEIQTQLYTTLLPNNRDLLKSLLSYIDLWRFRKV
jgi:hypothetical protein